LIESFLLSAFNKKIVSFFVSRPRFCFHHFFLYTFIIFFFFFSWHLTYKTNLISLFLSLLVSLLQKRYIFFLFCISSVRILLHFLFFSLSHPSIYFYIKFILFHFLTCLIITVFFSLTLSLSTTWHFHSYSSLSFPLSQFFFFSYYYIPFISFCFLFQTLLFIFHHCHNLFFFIHPIYFNRLIIILFTSTCVTLLTSVQTSLPFFYHQCTTSMPSH
jgi:hypothetical protein